MKGNEVNATTGLPAWLDVRTIAIIGTGLLEPRT